MLYMYSYRNRHNTYSDVWAPDVTTAMDMVRASKDCPGTFFTLYRVTNVPPREMQECA